MTHCDTDSDMTVTVSDWQDERVKVTNWPSLQSLPVSEKKETGKQNPPIRNTVTHS